MGRSSMLCGENVSRKSISRLSEMSDDGGNRFDFGFSMFMIIWSKIKKEIEELKMSKMNYCN